MTVLPTIHGGTGLRIANALRESILAGELSPGERWLLKPEQLDESGRLWSPGIRTGVAPGSYYHLTEFFGPILGIMRAATLEDAIRLQNQIDYGLTSGLHSLDSDELRLWLAGVQAGNLYVNRGITGAIVRRQPFGGWKRSVVGASTKAGGPNYLVHLGSWTSAKATVGAQPTDAVTAIVAAVGDPGVERAARNDQSEWEREFGASKDVSALGVERDIFRYLPLPVTVRLNEGGSPAELARVIAAGVRAGGTVQVTTGVSLHAGLASAVQAAGIAVTTETDEQWLKRASDGGITTSRVRLLGGGHKQLSEALGGSPDVAIYSEEVTEAGRVELLAFLREQAISITAHRFGNPDRWSEAVLPL